MMMENNSVLITGGGSGIGQALAVKLASEGCRVLVCGRNRDMLRKTRELAGGKISFVVADLSTAGGRNAIVDAVVAQNHGLDILINNAGVQYKMDFCTENSPPVLSERIENEVNINFIAPIMLTNQLLGQITRPGGRIVNVTSLLALHPKTSAPLYSATKAGLRSFTRSLRRQLTLESIKVVEVVPPLVETAMTRGRGRGKITPEQAAVEIVAGLKSGLCEIKVGKSKLVFLLNRIAPGLMAKVLAAGK